MHERQPVVTTTPDDYQKALRIARNYLISDEPGHLDCEWSYGTNDLLYAGLDQKAQQLQVVWTHSIPAQPYSQRTVFLLDASGNFWAETNIEPADSELSSQDFDLLLNGDHQGDDQQWQNFMEIIKSGVAYRKYEAGRLPTPSKSSRLQRIFGWLKPLK